MDAAAMKSEGMNISIVQVDYENTEQAAVLTDLFNAYSRDPMGGGEELDESVKRRLPKALASFPGAISLLAYMDGAAVGLCNAFEGFSTFYARPLINIHDLYVQPEYRGRGVAGKLLLEVERIARERGCSKMTLEVLEGNTPAQKSYRHLGFEPYRLDPAMGTAQFWQKILD